MGAVLALTLILSLDAGVAGDTVFVEAYRFGSFEHAVSLFVLPSGEFLVTDGGSESVLHLSSHGTVLHRTGGYGWQEGSFDGIGGVTSDGIVVGVADRMNHRIQRLDRRLIPQSFLSTRDTNEIAPRFGFPVSVAVTPFGDLLVLDGENRRLVKFSPAGRFDPAFGPSNAASRPLTEPLDVAVAPSGQIALLEQGAVHLLDPFGTEISVVRHPWLQRARGVGADNAAIWIATNTGLLRITSDGRSVTAIPIERILWSAPPRDLRDVATLGRQLFLLTPEEVIVCEVHDGY